MSACHPGHHERPSTCMTEALWAVMCTEPAHYSANTLPAPKVHAAWPLTLAQPAAAAAAQSECPCLQGH